MIVLRILIIYTNFNNQKFKLTNVFENKYIGKPKKYSKINYQI